MKAFPPFFGGSKDRKRLGSRGEDLAAEHLAARGYRIVARNYATPRGEIDIVAVHEGVVVFVEVKTRRGARFGLPHEAVDARKRERMASAARHYLASARKTSRPARFDIVSIMFDGETPAITHIEDAFELGGA